RFADSLLVSPDGTPKFVGECSAVWRGGTRRGRVVWKDHSAAPGIPAASVSDEHHDWEVVIDLASGPGEESQISDLPRAIWKPAELTPDETDAVKRFFVIKNEASVRENFADHIRSAFHAHMLILDRVLNRVFLEDGRLVIDGFDYNLTEEARSAATLSALFSAMLEPLFEMRYPQHPFFLRNLGLAEVSSLVSDLYSGSRQKLGDVQQIAQTFGLPLGLVKLSEGVYYPASREQLLSLETVRSIETLLDAAQGPLDLGSVYHELRKPPYGLVREAQQLILAAMVSQRMVEFVTSKGDRINQRSLDLKMIWDDIVGLARPQESSYSSAKLARWAISFSGREGIKDPSLDPDLAKFKEGATEWLAAWDSERVLGRFNTIPEELLNTRIWKTVTRVSRSLGAATSLIRKFLDGQTPVEECLGRISELFLDDPQRLESAKADLEIVKTYLDSWRQREDCRAYVLSAASTGHDRLEALREAVLTALAEFESSPSTERARKITYAFSRFQREFSHFYIVKHDSVMRSHDIQEKANELLSSDTWWMYDNLASLRHESPSVAEVERIRKRVALLDCPTKTEKILESYPQCHCGYDPAFHAEWESVVAELDASVRYATSDVMHDLVTRLATTAPRLEPLAEACSDTALAAAIKDVVRSLGSGKAPESPTPAHAKAFRLASSLLNEESSPAGEQDTPLLSEADVDSAVLSLA
ncbi:MAG TPA: DUF6079 family protein, partial [Pyrinomonadaceae bacterium]